MGKIMINVSESFSLIANEEEPVANIKIGAFIGTTQEKRYKYLMAHEGELLLPETYTGDFEEYLSSIQNG